MWILKSTAPGMKDSGTGLSSANTLPSTGPWSVYLCSQFVCTPRRSLENEANRAPSGTGYWWFSFTGASFVEERTS